MTVLSDADIAKKRHYEDLDIEPYDESNLQPASYDLTLGNEFVRYDERINEGQIQTMDTGPIGGETVTGHGYMLDPGEFVLGTTVETITLPDNVVGEVKGRSSIGRLGVIPHTAGWVDPGFNGNVTLEFVNHSGHTVALDAGMRCAQIVFTETKNPSRTPYGQKDDQKYQGQSGTTESRIEQDQP